MTEGSTEQGIGEGTEGLAQQFLPEGIAGLDEVLEDALLEAKRGGEGGGWRAERGRHGGTAFVGEVSDGGENICRGAQSSFLQCC